MPVIDRRGYTFFPTNDQTRMAREELKFKPDVKIEYGTPRRSFVGYTQNTDGSLTVPRAWGIKQIGRATIKFEDGTNISNDVRILNGFKLDETRCQDVAVQKILESMNTPVQRGGGIGIISLPCGGGKTVLFIYILVQIIRKKAMIVVHTNQLADQWEERFKFFCPKIRIGRVQGSTVLVEDCDVVICMLQTLSMKNDLCSSLFDDVSVMAIDECHLVCTETFGKLLTRWGVKFMFGLSATPVRKDKLECVLFAHLGGIIYSGTRERVPVKVIFEHTDVTQCKELMNPRSRKPDHVGMITHLVEDEKRTKLIATRAVEHMLSKVLVLSERRTHLERIMHHIIEMNPENMSEVGLYRGNMKPDLLKDSETKSIILGTYSIASVGLDIKGLNTLILATPRSDVVQASGRIQRDISPLFGKKIIDFYDKFSVFTGQYAKRLQYYKTAEFEVTPTKRKREITAATTVSTFLIDSSIV